MIIIDDQDDDESDIKILESTVHQEQDQIILKNLISKIDLDTELIIVQSNSPIRICTSALSYSNLADNHIILVNIINSIFFFLKIFFRSIIL